MRILLSSPGAELYGSERVLIALAEQFAQRGHAVTIELPHDDGPAADVLRRTPGVGLIVSDRPRLPRNAAELLRWTAGSLGAVRRIRTIFRDGRFDVVWVNSIYNPWAGLAARWAGVPVVWHLHERNLPGPAGSVLARWISTCADVPVAVSRFVAEGFERCPPLRGRVRVLYNALLEPIEPAPLPDRTDDAAFIVGCIGQLEPRKRPWDVIEAVARVPGTTALLVGDGKARDRLDRVISESGVRDRVALPGFQSDVRPWYTRSDCIVIPSRNEPFGLVALEAIATGRPVIAADSGALPEVLSDAALYYPLGDAAALAERIERLRGDPDLRQDLRRRGLHRVSRFSVQHWAAVAEDLAVEAIERCER